MIIIIKLDNKVARDFLDRKSNNYHAEMLVSHENETKFTPEEVRYLLNNCNLTVTEKVSSPS